MSVKIITDSASDIRPDEAKQLGITVLPLKTNIDGVEYLDGVTITHEEFYQKLSSCKQLPTTSQLSPYEFECAYRDALETHDEAVVITLSGKLSGTAQSAFTAAQDFDGKVFVVDSENATIGEHILVSLALRLRDLGLSAEAIANELNRVKNRVCLVALVDTLDYLVKGGRLSKTVGFAGSLLQIKPVLGVEEGEVRVLGKARGAKQSSNMLTDTISKKGGIDFTMPLMLAYSGTDDSLLKDYIENSRSIWEGNIDELPISVIGSTIGTHAGPGAVAVAFFAKEQA